jgi:hypothetical protein
LRKHDGRRGEGVGLGNDDGRCRRARCSKFLPAGRGVVNAVTGDDFHDGVGVGGRGRKGIGRRGGARGRGMQLRGGGAARAWEPQECGGGAPLCCPSPLI